MGSSTRCTS